MTRVEYLADEMVAKMADNLVVLRVGKLADTLVLTKVDMLVEHLVGY